MARRAEQARGVKLGYMATGKVLSVYISSYKELNPSKSPFRLDPSPRNAELVLGAPIAGECR